MKKIKIILSQILQIINVFLVMKISNMIICQTNISNISKKNLSFGEISSMSLMIQLNKVA